jgi:signal peptidase I
MTQPPPIPQANRPKTSRLRRVAILIACLSAIFMALVVVVLVICPLTGHPLLKNFAVPTNGMDPTISKGDMILAEGFSLWTRPASRADVIVFKTAGIAGLESDRHPPGTVFVQRIAAIAGDSLEFQSGKVLVNGVEFITRAEGRELRYEGRPHTASVMLLFPEGKATVPAGHVFTLGDNTQRSADGRYWGFVPVQNIQMRARLRLAPSQRRGAIQ